MRPTLFVMVKEPNPGRVKTRLARDIGAVPAAWWFRHAARALIRRLRDPRWRLVLAVSPDRAGRASRVWPGDLPRLAQGGGDLGTRMGRLLRAPGPVAVIGADLPGVERIHIARAFAALGDHDAVLGPATDGGYWLVGARGPLPRGLFRDVRWSSEHALADTRASAPGLRWAIVDTVSDVDTAADLARSKLVQSALTVRSPHASRQP